ncbi:HTH-type transcriptional regulator [Arthrobacter sp. SO5]|uniref:ArsR/SmtB family transcription factor n=1 Tax=Arthrobacter sp. SO5 TaxID=1897055 RepID=UPI001E48DA2A|nr:metalloregulator ArsR/SmtB family transcription factor [Arthrobacter sp. SO5]MCB5273331.1 HTH-type transcriptional regulator [Arthrobacter sp. SO5]
MSTATTDLTASLHALGDPSRRQLLQRLALGPATSGQLADVVTVSRPAASQHLGILVQAGLVRSSNAGRNRWNELNPEPLVDVETWIRALLDTWTDSPTLSTPRSPVRKEIR